MLKDVNFSVVYATGEHEPLEFFLKALSNSKDAREDKEQK